MLTALTPTKFMQRNAKTTAAFPSLLRTTSPNDTRSRSDPNCYWATRSISTLGANCVKVGMGALHSQVFRLEKSSSGWYFAECPTTSDLSTTRLFGHLTETPLPTSVTRRRTDG